MGKRGRPPKNPRLSQTTEEITSTETLAADDNTTADDTEYAEHDHRYNPPRQHLRAQDYYLPLGNVEKVLKREVPPTQAKIAQATKECVQECLTEFILFVAGEALEYTAANARKTLEPQDVISALVALGLDQYAEVMQLFCDRYKAATDEMNESVKEQLNQPIDDFDFDSVLMGDEGDDEGGDGQVHARAADADDESFSAGGDD